MQIPWSEAVEDLVGACARLQVPLVAVLERQYRLLQLKKLLHDYGIRDFNFSDLGRGQVRSKSPLIIQPPIL